MRARKKKWAPTEIANNPLIIQREANETISLREFFYQSRLASAINDTTNKNELHFPIHMEIGCGKGRFITESARRNPDINYLAIEREPAILAAAARLGVQVALESPLSLAFLLLDVSELGERIQAGEVTRLYINFCDPWMRKKKWAKRCLTHENFLKIYQKLGIKEIHFKTDNRFLFEFSLESFNNAGCRMTNISLDLHANMPEDNIVTEYEQKFSAHGPIYRLEAKPPCLHIL